MPQRGCWLQHKQLGRTGVQVPEIGLGTHRFMGGVEPLRRGIEAGAAFVDTAEAYGTETVVGQAVAGCRDRVLIATKVSPAHLHFKDVIAAADRSLKLLNTDYIDLYQIHHFNPAIPLSETLGAMQDLINSGKVRYIGVCNFSISQLRQAQAALPKHAIVTNQLEFNLMARSIEPGLLQYCRENSITIIAHSPLSRGLQNLKSRDPADSLIQVAQATGKTEAQVALNWCISQEEVIAIPKSNALNRVEENCSASGWRLSTEHMALLESNIAPIRRRGPTETALRKLARRILTSVQPD